MRGQVWIETVLYTLIGLALIGVVLAFVSPKITDARDRIVVQQTLNSLALVDEKINIILDAEGNRRNIDFTMKRGELFIGSENDEIVFVLNDLRKPYSEPGEDIFIGNINITSEEGPKYSTLYMTLSYPNQNIMYGGQDIDKKFTPSAIPYKFSFYNKGNVNNDGIAVIEVTEISE